VRKSSADGFAASCHGWRGWVGLRNGGEHYQPFLYRFSLAWEIIEKALPNQLQVAEAFKQDAYKDIVRIHWRERGKHNKIGSIVAISVDGGPWRLFSLLGLPDEHKGQIRFDHVSRDELELKLGEVHNFEIKETNVWQKLMWAVRATDPAARIAAWIAVWSAILGILALVIGIIALWRC
jgi:hypothetical protein